MLLSIGIFRLGWKIKRKVVCTENTCLALIHDRNYIKAKAMFENNEILGPMSMDKASKGIKK